MPPADDFGKETVGESSIGSGKVVVVADVRIDWENGTVVTGGTVTDDATSGMITPLWGDAETSVVESLAEFFGNIVREDGVRARGGWVGFAAAEADRAFAVG